MVNILCTRSLDPEDVLKAKGMGLRVDVVPFIRIVSIRDEDLKNDLHDFADQEILAAFTSKHAVRTVRHFFEGERTTAQLKWDIACLDEATLREVYTLFPNKKIVAVAANASLLAAELIEHVSRLPSRKRGIVLFNGDRSLTTIMDACRQMNLNVQAQMVYRTELTPVVIGEHYHGIIFMSPSAVESYFQLNVFPQDCAAFCIGKTTECAFIANAPDVRDIICAAGHTFQSILEAIRTHYER